MDEDAQTLANFLKFYTPSIVGGSLGSHVGEVSQNVQLSYLMCTMILHVCKTD